MRSAQSLRVRRQLSFCPSAGAFPLAYPGANNERVAVLIRHTLALAIVILPDLPNTQENRPFYGD